ADQLSANERRRHAVAQLARAGRPVAAEGAGLVWLTRDLDGRPMCGVLDATARSGDRYTVGYREAVACDDSNLLVRGAAVTGHKLHSTSVAPRAGDRPAWRWAGGYPEGFLSGGVHASFLCLHWAGAAGIPARFVAAASRTAIAPEPPTPPT